MFRVARPKARSSCEHGWHTMGLFPPNGVSFCIGARNQSLALVYAKAELADFDSAIRSVRSLPPQPRSPAVSDRAFRAFNLVSRLPLSQSPHGVAHASDSASWDRHRILRDALLPALRAFVRWVSLVPMPCFYLLDGKRLSGGKISFAILSKRSRHLLNRELTVFGLSRSSAAISS